MARGSQSGRASAGEIRLFWVIVWAVSVAFAIGVYRPNWEALERRRTGERDLLGQIERLTDQNARWRAGIELLQNDDRRTWEMVIRRRYGYTRRGEIPCRATDFRRDG